MTETTVGNEAPVEPGIEPGADQQTEPPVSAWKRPLVVALAAISVSALGLMAIIGEVIVPLLVFGVLFAVAAVLNVRLHRKWPVWVAIVLSAGLVLGNLPIIIEDLAHPETPMGFVPTWIMLVGAIFAVAAGILILRRSTARPKPSSLAAIGVAAVASVASVVMGLSLTDDELRPGDVVVLAEGAEFPEEIRVPAGPVAFYLENKDPIRHTFVIEGHGVAQEMPGSTNRRVEADLSPGTYEYICDVPGHERMKGTLIVD